MVFRWIIGVLLFVVLLFVIAILAIRTPIAQQFITDKAVSFVSEKTQTRIELKRLFITFRGDVQLEGVYLEDAQQDTLIFIRELEAGVAFLPLIDGNIIVSRVNWNGLMASVHRDQDSTFNFDFLIDAFAGSAEPDTIEKVDSPLPEIGLGPIKFTDFKLHYHDELLGLDAKLDLGKLNLTTEEVDLKSLEFKVDKLELENVKLDANNWLASSVSEEDTSEIKLPFISCNNLSLIDIELNYTSIVDSMDVSTELGELAISNTALDLQNQDISVDELILKNSDVRLQLPATEPEETTAAPTPFIWPDWNLNLGRLELADNSVELKMGRVLETPNAFNANDLRIDGLQVLVENVKLMENQANLELTHLALSEKSGFRLNKLGLKANLDDEQLAMKGLNLKTPFNHLSANFSLTFEAIDSLMKNPFSADFNLDLGEADLSLEDAFYFAPDLKDDSMLRDLSTYPLKLSGVVSGRLDDITIKNFKVNALQTLELNLDGRISGLPDTSYIKVDVPRLNVSLSKKDISIFVKDMENTNAIPEKMELEASVKGGIKELATELDLQTEKGNVSLSANIKDIMEIPSAKGSLKLINIDVASLASVEKIEPVSLSLVFNARGNALDNLSADLGFAFQQLKFNSYDYSDLKMTVIAADQKASVTAQMSDENIDFELGLNVTMDTLNPAADLELNLKGINLLALGHSAEQVKLGANFSASYSGLPESFQSSLGIKNIVLVNENEAYQVRPVTVQLNNSVESSFLAVQSEIINGKLIANTSIDSLIELLTNHLIHLTNAGKNHPENEFEALDVAAHFTVNNSRLLAEALLPDLARLDTIHLDLEFHSSRNEFDFNLIAPKTVYADFRLDSFGLNATTNGSDLKGKLALQKLKGGPIDINRTTIDFDLIENQANVKLAIADSVGGMLAAIGTSVDMTTEQTLLSFVPEGFILNGETWEIPIDNQILFTESGSVFRSVKLSNTAQQISLENLKSGNTNGVNLHFDGFELASFTSILNAKHGVVSGALNGSVQLVDFNTNLGINADINLSNLAVLGLDMGQLALLATTKDNHNYDLDLSVKGEPIDFSVKGFIAMADELSLDLKANLNRLNIKLVEGFTAGELKNSSGSLEAHATIIGASSDIRYDGSVAFNQASFSVSQLNTQFILPNEKVQVDNDGIVFKAFNIIDESGNHVQIDGEIGTRNMLDPSFDLQVVANNFQLLNSTRDDNELFFGKAFVQADVKVGGKLNLPKVDAQAKLLKGTDITFIVPESQAAIEERKGLVTFINMKDTLSTILATDKIDEELHGFKGVDMVGYLEIDRSTKFQIVIDERSGDKVQIEGEAKLNAEMTPNGIVSLSGNYEVANGSYNLNLYGLAKRKFELVSGSQIVWSGDPLAAELDLSAKYSLKTSSSELMADQIAQSDATTLVKYKQALPFEVMLNINGELLKPEIFFGIDMPESARQALDGNVYKRVRQLNSNSSELDKQVFSLIVLNRFLPKSFNQYEGSGSKSLARSSASKLLSGQLNALSAKYLKGVELNFDLNSYTDYQSGVADDKTQLDVSIRKALFQDRVVVQVGGQVDLEGNNKSYDASDILGDISLEYLITKEGDYRLKAFRKNEFQDLVQGQVVVMGLSIMFNKSFGYWKELLRGKPKQESGGVKAKSDVESKGTKAE
ncbi:MAG: translocation and assembly module TamB [Granulosicoccus sp.]|jgi:translocation and assembly module TamB